MASITLTVPNPIANRVLDACAALKGYTGFLMDETTPQTKAEFYKSHLISYTKNLVSLYESQTAANLAAQTAQADVETNISIS